MTTVDPQRRAVLLGLKLAALVRDHLGLADTDAFRAPASFGGGAALVHDDAAWVLADVDPARALGGALVWAERQGASSLHLLAEDAVGLLARRASLFAPAPQVWRVEGRSLVPAQPEPLPVPPEVDPRLAPLAVLIEAGGAAPVVEHGVLSGEVDGLEVCRAVLDPDLDVARLEVGVGAHDREAFLLVHGDLPTEQALAEVVQAVATHRSEGGLDHPLRRLGAERLLRSRLVAEPGLVGARSLALAAPPVPRANVKDPVPAIAVGTDADGATLVVAASVGVDLDLVPYAADARLALDPSARLVLAVPHRDDYPATRFLAARLAFPAEIRTVTFG